MVKDQLSAWMDGEIGAEESAHIEATLMRQSEPRAVCDAYWLIGDVLRGEAPMSADFTNRVMAAIEDEPSILAPVSRPSVQRQTPRWMPMAAAVAGIAVAGWASLSLTQSGEPAPVSAGMIASVQSDDGTPTVAARTVSSVRGGYDDDRAYMMAHQNYGVGSAMPSMAGYIRMVGDEQVDARR